MGGPGIPATSPGQAATPPGVEPPDPDRSWSEPLGVLDLWGLPGLRKSVSWLVNPLSCDEIDDSRIGPAGTCLFLMLGW